MLRFIQRPLSPLRKKMLKNQSAASCDGQCIEHVTKIGLSVLCIINVEIPL